MAAILLFTTTMPARAVCMILFAQPANMYFNGALYPYMGILLRSHYRILLFRGKLAIQCLN